MITHHPADELLLDYAAGALGEGLALAVASHVSLCRVCFEQVEVLEAVGGALLEGMDEVPVSEALLDETLALIDAPEPARSTRTPAEASGHGRVPAPLLPYVGKGLDHLAWRKMGGIIAALEEARLPVAAKSVKVALMRLKAGSVTPRHTHRGNEYAVVLAGGFSDAGKQFRPGDFLARDPSHTHQPVVDADGDCLCLVVLDAPLQLSGVMGKIVNPFLRI